MYVIGIFCGFGKRYGCGFGKKDVWGSGGGGGVGCGCGRWIIWSGELIIEIGLVVGVFDGG